MDVVGYFKTSSALAKWKLRPAQPENYFMSVDEEGVSYSKLPPEASTLLGAVLLISWFYRQRDFGHQSSGEYSSWYTEFPFRFSRFSSFTGPTHDSVHNKPSHYLFFRACFASQTYAASCCYPFRLDDDAHHFLFWVISGGLIGLRGLLIWINVISLTAFPFVFVSTASLSGDSAQLGRCGRCVHYLDIRALHQIFTALHDPVCLLGHQSYMYISLKSQLDLERLPSPLVSNCRCSSPI